MRWSHLAAAGGDPSDRAAPVAPPLPLALPGATVRTFDTPSFAGMAFYEIRAKSIINRVPGASRLPFQWTINPYRGCSHACTYCFARNTHTYLDLDAGHDFDTKIVVKVNAGELVRRELSAPTWRGEPIAMGTNVDVYQRAEGRYRLMPQILAALRDVANPFSILTKGTLILRDLELLKQAAEVTAVGLTFSVGFVDEQVWRAVEPGTPSPRRRLEAVRALTDAGFAVSVLMAPILPGLTDTDESIEQTVAAIAAAGAVSVTPLPLHLRPGAREWYAAWLTREHPELAPRYRELYRRGPYLSQPFQAEIGARVRLAARRHGLHRRDPVETRRVQETESARPSGGPASDALARGDPPRDRRALPASARAQAEQLTLL
ncbi:Rv2578c family radical SAM protein [Krasilnikovia sp. MM14-A1259]|uniref:Rv2578c family radical SAM protein n=1 Tax=Krasilnikovia sp. MM14-A1259 TaxID=3373539 RepID=UPI00382116E1